jgi:hypothetical protein
MATGNSRNRGNGKGTTENHPSLVEMILSVAPLSGRPKVLSAKAPATKLRFKSIVYRQANGEL